MSSKINNENDYLDVLKTEYVKIIGKNPRGRYAGERWWLKKKIKEAKNEQNETSSAHGPGPARAVIPEGNMNADGAAMVLQSMNLVNVTLRQQRDVRPADDEQTNTSDVAARNIQSAHRRYVAYKTVAELRRQGLQQIDIDKEKSILPFSAEKKKEKDSPIKVATRLAEIIHKMKMLQKENDALKLQNQKYSSELDDFKSMLNSVDIF